MLTLSIWLSFAPFISEVTSLSCGIDRNSPGLHVYEGFARIETYPWLGVLYYPYKTHKYTTAVVLVTRQIVLAAANEIDKLPKHNFRSLARVVLGHNCTGRSVGIRDYTYHPDYSKNTYSTLAMIQLEIDHATVELRPICPPPSHFKDESFLAMVLADNCKRSRVRIHKMKYVYPEQCKSFYRRTDLDVDTMWPSHTACARSVSGGHCVWRSGAILVVKVGTRWRLLGFGVYGPGCEAPARFLDYGMYHDWVQRTVERIGRPAITTLADNHIVMRRTISSVQRFGPCDREEMKRELYTEDTAISIMEKKQSRIRHNMTIIADVEYSCIVFKAEHDDPRIKHRTPKLKLRRWCAGGSAPKGLCFGFGFMEIHYYVEILFENPIKFSVTAYGREATFIQPTLVNKYLNRHKKSPIILSYTDSKLKVKWQLRDLNYPAYGKFDYLTAANYISDIELLKITYEKFLMRNMSMGDPRDLIGFV